MALAPSSSIGEEETAGNIYVLGEVVVSAPGERRIEAAPARTISASEIRETGASTLDEALTMIPGLQVRRGNDGITRIDIRGFRTRHVLLMLNGIPINSSYDGQFNPEMFPVENIAQIKVIPGGASVLFGPDSNGGVINIITKKGLPGIHGSADGRLHNGKGTQNSFTASGVSENISIFISGNASGEDGYPLPDDFTSLPAENGGLRDNSNRQSRTFFTTIDYDAAEGTKLGFTLDYRNGGFGIQPVTTTAEDPFGKNPKFERIDRYNGLSGQVSFSRVMSSSMFFRGWGYVNTLREIANGYDNADYADQNNKGSYHSSTRTRVSGLNVQLLHNLNRYGNLTWSVLYRGSGWNDSGFLLEQQSRRDPVSKVDLEQDRMLRLYSFLVEHTASPIQNLDLVLGLGSHVQQRDGGNDASDVSYQVGASYGLASTLSLTAAHTRSVRFPSVRELFDPQSGVADLTAERTLQYEIGMTYVRADKLSARLSGFITDADNFIEKDTTEIFRNFERYFIQGVEAETEVHPGRAMIRGACSLLDAEDRSTGKERGVLQYRPRAKLTLESGYSFPFGLSARLSVLHIRGQYFYSRTTPLMKKRLNDYTIFNLNCIQKISNNGIGIDVGIQNLFDEEYEQSYGLPQPGRIMYGGFSFAF